MISLTTGQEMKISVNSVDTSINSRKKTIRYLDPLATNSIDTKLTSLAKDLFANSQNSYKSTSGSIELGILSET